MFQCTIPVEVERFIGGVVNPLGNEVATWAAPETIMVFAIFTRYGMEEQGDHVSQVELDAVMYPKATENIRPQDRIIHDLGTFEVEGEPIDHNHNPWWSPGLVQVNLKKVTG